MQAIKHTFSGVDEQAFSTVAFNMLDRIEHSQHIVLCSCPPSAKVSLSIPPPPSARTHLVVELRKPICDPELEVAARLGQPVDVDALHHTLGDVHAACMGNDKG